MEWLAGAEPVNLGSQIPDRELRSPPGWRQLNAARPLVRPSSRLVKISLALELARRERLREMPRAQENCALALRRAGNPRRSRPWSASDQWPVELVKLQPPESVAIQPAEVAATGRLAGRVCPESEACHRRSSSTGDIA